MTAKEGLRLTAARTGLAGLQQVASAAGNAGFLVVTARFLPAAERGALATYVVVVGVAAGLASAGWPSASLFFSATGANPRKLLRVMAKPIAFFAAAATVAAYFGLETTGIGTFVSPSILLVLVVGGIASSAASTGAQWTVMGVGNFTNAAWARLAASIYLVSVPLFLQWMGLLSIVTAIAVWVSAWIVSLGAMFSVAFSSSSTSRSLIGPVVEVPSQRVRGYAMRSLPSGLGNYLSARADQWVVAAMIGLAAAGSYSIALGLVELLALVPQALAAALFAGEARGDARTTIRTSVMLPAGIVALAAFVLALIAPFLVPWTFGEEYASAVRPVQLLAAASVFLSAQRAHGAVLAGRGYPGINSIASAFMAAILGLFCWLLIPIYGLNGAALASIASYSGGLVVTVLLGAAKPSRLISGSHS